MNIILNGFKFIDLWGIKAFECRLFIRLSQSNWCKSNSIIVSIPTMRLTYSAVDWKLMHFEDFLRCVFFSSWIFLLFHWDNSIYIPIKVSMFRCRCLPVVIQQIFLTNVLLHHFRYYDTITYLVDVQCRFWMKIEYFTFWTISIFSTSIHIFYFDQFRIADI